MARNLDFPAVNTAELEDGLRVWKRLLLEGQPADAPIVVLARGKVVRWLEDFLRQSGECLALLCGLRHLR